MHSYYSQVDCYRNRYRHGGGRSQNSKAELDIWKKKQGEWKEREVFRHGGGQRCRERKINGDEIELVDKRMGE